MEIHQLRYCLAVAETQNFTRASEQCNISQPALSQQIINLEKELGQKLFHRLGRRAVLTEAGTVFLGRARKILLEVDDAKKELSDQSAFDRRIVVGAVQSVMPYILTGLIAQCRETHPNLLIESQEDFREDLVEAVVEGGLDLAVVPLPIDEPRVSVEPLFKEPLLLVVSRSHPFATRSEIDIHDVGNEQFVSLGDSSTLAAQVRNFFGAQHLEPRISFRCAQIDTLKLFVAKGLGISLLPQAARQPDDQNTLVYLRLTGSVPTRELAVIRHLQRYQSRGVEQFLALLREHVRRNFDAVASASTSQAEGGVEHDPGTTGT